MSLTTDDTFNDELLLIRDVEEKSELFLNYVFHYLELGIRGSFLTTNSIFQATRR